MSWPLTCTHQAPFFPPGKTASARMAVFDQVMKHRWHRGSLGSLCVAAWPIVAGGCWLGVLQSLSGVPVCQPGTAQEPPEVPARVSLCFCAIPGLCLCLLDFLKPVGEENTCCDSCSKKEVKTFLGFEVTELAKSLQIELFALYLLCEVKAVKTQETTRSLSRL